MAEIKSYHDLKYDELTDVPTVIDYIHHEIHDENHYQAHIDSPTLGDGDSFEMYFKTPDSAKRCHTVIVFSGELGGVGELRESATVSLSGSVVTIFNNDRNSSNESTAAVRSSPSLTASGTRLDHFHIGGGFQARNGGAAGSRMEWILKQGTIYLFRYTSIAAANEAGIEVAFYEE